MKIEDKRKEAEAIMAREDLPEDFPSAEESEKDVVGRAFKVTYAPIPSEVEEDQPEPEFTAYAEDVKRFLSLSAAGNNKKPYSRRSTGALSTNSASLPGREEREDMIRHLSSDRDFEQEAEKVMAEIESKDAVVTVEGVYRHALEALDGLLDNPINNVEAIVAVTNVLSGLKQIDITDKINPLATRAGEIPLRK